MIVSFVLFLLLFVGIGIASSFKKKSNSHDYLLAGQNVQPWLVALSAVATNNSGYMFIGMIGYTYTYGLSSIWIMLGWILGDLFVSVLVHKKMRGVTSERNVHSFGDLLSKWTGKELPYLRIVIGVFIIIFLGTYAAAQLTAGAKALFSLLELELHWGIIIGTVIVVAYCFAGGIRASIWTDAAQSIVMIFAMGILVFFCVEELGGWTMSKIKLDNVSDTFMNFTTPKNPFGEGHIPGLVLFILGWLFAGFCVIGQPHIMVRLMSLNDPKNVKTVWKYYYSWFIAFYAMAITVGLFSRVLIPMGEGFDPELALPEVSGMILPGYLAGIVLAGIFAATISTADSLVLSCSASFTNEIFSRFKNNYLFGKVATLTVALIALTIALNDDQSIFKMVVGTWSTLGSSFGVLLFLLVFKEKPGQWTSIALILAGLIITYSWRFMGYDEVLYEALPGITGVFIFYGILRVTKLYKY